MLEKYLLRLCLVCIFVVAYYKYAKSYLIAVTPKLTSYLRLTRYFPADDIKGVVELALIASSHVIYCVFLLWIMPIHVSASPKNLINIPILFIYGILSGIGCMGLSALFCKIGIQMVTALKKDGSYDLKSWLTVGRGGWIKHHLQSMEILPFYLSLLILTMQVGSEEVIFRGVMLNYFLPFGGIIAFLTSLVLFILMQAFLMNRWQGAIFPMIGAAVMGFIHSILYLRVPILWPLIISHVTFFLFSVL